MIRIIKTILGIILIPAAIGTAQAFYSHISLLNTNGGGFLIMERGILAYVLFHVLIKRPIYIYVLGHELVHILATWICGGKVESFKVSLEGGNVVTSKTNSFIELSPYFVPLYTLILGPLFLLAKMFIPGAGYDITNIFLFLVGATLAFHFVMTTEVVKMSQSDIQKSGFIFSIIYIFIFNLIVVAGVFSPFFEQLSFMEFLKDIYVKSYNIYIYIYSTALMVIEEIQPQS